MSKVPVSSVDGIDFAFTEDELEGFVGKNVNRMDLDRARYYIWFGNIAKKVCEFEGYLDEKLNFEYEVMEKVGGDKEFQIYIDVAARDGLGEDLSFCIQHDDNCCDIKVQYQGSGDYFFDIIASKPEVFEGGLGDGFDPDAEVLDGSGGIVVDPVVEDAMLKIVELARRDIETLKERKRIAESKRKRDEEDDRGDEKRVRVEVGSCEDPGAVRLDHDRGDERGLD